MRAGVLVDFAAADVAGNLAGVVHESDAQLAGGGAAGSDELFPGLGGIGGTVAVRSGAP